MKGLPKMATLWARKPPEVGKTPADVVYRENKLMLLRYRPRPEGVRFETPLLLVPSLINRHYVLDLMPGKSFIEIVASRGYVGVSVSYRLAPRDKFPAQIQDVRTAVRFLKANARQLNIDPDRIAALGFSAGGHLAIATATRFEKRTYELTDDIDKISCRPDFAIAVYPGYLKAKDKEELAPGLRVPAKTPPIFLAHGGADIIAPPEHSVFMYLALRRAGVPAAAHRGRPSRPAPRVRLAPQRPAEIGP